VTILKSMSFNDGRGLQIVGSSSIRSQQYAGDFDGYQVVEMSESSDAAAAKRVAQEWQANIKRLRGLPDVFIGDIKCGEVAEWRVIPEDARLQDGKIIGYNPTQSLAKVDRLEAANIISPAEAAAARKLLPPGMDIGIFLQAKQTLKFHIIRWTAREILAGRKKLRDNRVITLAQACRLPGMAKMDAIAKVQNSRFTDFSVIYEFRNRGRVLNPYRYDVRESLREAVVAYRREGDSFKALKRIYTLARYENDMDTVRELTPILNSDLGRLYHITSDMRTLVELLQQPRVPIADIRYEVDQFVGRLSGIYKLEDVLKKEGDIIGRLHAITKMQKGQMAQALERLADQLDGYLQYATEHMVGAKQLTGGVTAGEVVRTIGSAAGVGLTALAISALSGRLDDTSLAVAGALGALTGAVGNAGLEALDRARRSETPAAPARRTAAPPHVVYYPYGRAYIAEPIEEPEESDETAAIPRMPTGPPPVPGLMPAPMAVPASRRLPAALAPASGLTAAPRVTETTDEDRVFSNPLNVRRTNNPSRGRGRMTGGGPFTDQLHAALAEVGLRYGTAPVEVQRLFERAKAALERVGPTSRFGMDPTGLNAAAKANIVDDFRMKLRNYVRVNPMFEHAPGAAVGGPQSMMADLGLPRPLSRIATAAAPAPAAAAVAAPRVAPAAAAVAAPLVAPAVAAAAAPRAAQSKVKTVFEPKPVGRGKMSGGGPFKDELIAIANQFFPGAGTYVRAHIGTHGPWRNRFESAVASYYERMAERPTNWDRAEKRRLLERATLELHDLASHMVLQNYLEQRTQQLRLAAEARRRDADERRRPIAIINPDGSTSLAIPESTGRGRTEEDDDLEGGATPAERRYMAAQARLADLDRPLQELRAFREQLRPIRDNPSEPMARRRQAAAAMDAMAADMEAYMAPRREEFLELRNLLRGLPKPSLTPGSAPRARAPAGRSPLSR
jgi:hypothetical protein